MTMSCNQSSTNRLSIVMLVHYHKWPHLDQILKLDDINKDVLIFDDRKSNRLPEKHILHFACQHQAPPSTLELLAKRYPESLCTRETKGRYPIHFACAKGLAPIAIDFLLMKLPSAAIVQDNFGKTPLHYVCESYAYNYENILDNAYRSSEKSTSKVVSMILDAYPGAANVEDLYGMSPIEYAIESDMDIGIIKLMQKSSRENWRELSQRFQDKSHDERKQSITSLSSSFSSITLSPDRTSETPKKRGRDGSLYGV